MIIGYLEHESEKRVLLEFFSEALGGRVLVC